jgi:tryptophan halogenase
MADRPRIREIAIAGGTLAGWLTAAVLAATLPRGRFTLSLVDEPNPAPDLDTLPGGLATLPAIRSAHNVLGLPEPALIERADAGFSLGAEFAGWGPSEGYFRPFSPFGAPLDGVAFHNLWLRLRRAGGAGDIEDYALGAVAARLGRFALPSADEASVLSTLDYGYHLDGAGYRDLLRAAAERAGVTRLEGAIAGSELRAADGYIDAIRLEDGRRIAADFFIDCTGAEGVLIEGALATGVEDWSQWLPCDRIATARVEGEPLPYLRAEAVETGWRWLMPLGRGAGTGHVYASAFAADEADALPFASGRRRKFWNRNCVAIGASACVIDPLEPSALQAIQRGISQFLALLPFKDEEAGEADEYDRIMGETVERMRDLVILHYKASKRAGPFWDECRAMSLPDILAYKIRLFEAKARVLELDEEMFQDSDWVAVYLGSGVAPRAYDTLADMAGETLVRDRLESIRTAMRAAAEAMPAYADFLAGART